MPQRTSTVLIPVLLACGILAAAQGRQSSAIRAPVITLGQSVIPLYGPWKFQIGDSPIDPRTGESLWAEPDFDDSHWETVDLTPRPGIVDPFTGDPRYLPGWTTNGHPGYWGYAWYRFRVPMIAAGGNGLAFATYGHADDASPLWLALSAPINVLQPNSANGNEAAIASRTKSVALTETLAILPLAERHPSPDCRKQQKRTYSRSAKASSSAHRQMVIAEANAPPCCQSGPFLSGRQTLF